MRLNILPELIDQIRSEMEELSDDGRLDLVRDIMRGYCMECGTETHGRQCHCQNDE